MKELTVCHLNIIGFRAAVMMIKDSSLSTRPFVIAGAAGGRALALDCSPQAVQEGIFPGMPLAAAGRLVRDLIILPPDFPAYTAMNTELEKVAARYAPVWENDKGGNFYLDLTGTQGLFGPPADCTSRILRDMFERAAIRPAAAIACNKLVSKVATRTIRPDGLIQVQQDTEEEFLSHQDIRILPGMGPALLRTACVTGIREIGELAALSVAQAISLFGKRGPLLRNMARGIDSSRVEERKTERRICRRADFSEDVIDETAIRASIGALAEQGGLEMRNEKLGASGIRLALRYSDGVEAQGFQKTKQPLVTDRDLMAASYELWQKTVKRRIRIRAIGISFEDMTPLGYQPDLFEPETEAKNRKLQEAADKIQNRFGAGKVSKGLVLFLHKEPRRIAAKVDPQIPVKGSAAGRVAGSGEADMLVESACAAPQHLNTSCCA